MSFLQPSVSAPPLPPKPKFPRYLLPTLRIPFTRWRIPESPLQSPGSSDPPSPTGSNTSTSSTSSTSAVPSLSTSPTSPTTPSPTRRRLSRARPDTLRCRSCATDFAFHTQIVSKGFRGRHGRAYLVAPPPPVFPTAVRSRIHAPPNTITNTTTSRRHVPFTPVLLQQRPPQTAVAKVALAEDLIEELISGANLLNVTLGPEEDRPLMTGQHVVADAKCAVCGATVGWKYVAADQPSQAYKVGCFILETRKVASCRGWEEGDERVVDGRAGLSLDGRPLGVDGSEEEVIPVGWAEDWKGEGEKELDTVVFDSDDEDECEDMFEGVWDSRVVACRRRRKAGKA
ncbi:hypothetical protein F5144DRAFT_627847 [Chaetomium tenue]|uniref:Uncharacterized protein n=1 Tax=Chaetomium tenue TaxID=1854479 RepID=A0ACB7PQ48_9PEZI|nr:hypothetical protein F5144DRAFT_627847 [Chaetomium globosum]